MRIEVPAEFWHAGNLSTRDASRDPRQTLFKEPRVEVDMRGCNFIRPAALLWCAVYPLLAVRRGSDCTLLVPENVGTCLYLKAAGLFQLLQETGVSVDDRGVSDREVPQLILPLARFCTEADVERVANQALDALSKAGMGSANLYPLISEIFAELALNAVQHAESEVGAFGLIQFYESQNGRRFVCAVADGGIGIRRSLEKNPALRDRVPYDWAAIEVAIQEGVSGTGSKTRGIGLYGVAEDMRKEGRQLIIHSGIGMLQITEDLESSATRTSLFPGTLTYASIPS